MKEASTEFSAKYPDDIAHYAITHWNTCPNPALVEGETIFRLLAGRNIVGAELWHGIYKQFFKHPALIQKAFSLLIQATARKLLDDNCELKRNCWEILLQLPPDLLLKPQMYAPVILHGYSNESGVIHKSCYIALKILYKTGLEKVKDNKNEITIENISRFHVYICELLENDLETALNLIKVETEFLEHIHNLITPQLYILLTNKMRERIALHGSELWHRPEMRMYLTSLSMFGSTPELQKLSSSFAQEILRTFEGQPKILHYLLDLLPTDRKDFRAQVMTWFFETVRKIPNDNPVNSLFILTANEELYLALHFLILQRALEPKILLEILQNEHTRAVLGEAADKLHKMIFENLVPSANGATPYQPNYIVQLAKGLKNSNLRGEEIKQAFENILQQLFALSEAQFIPVQNSHAVHIRTLQHSVEQLNANNKTLISELETLKPNSKAYIIADSKTKKNINLLKQIKVEITQFNNEYFKKAAAIRNLTAHTILKALTSYLYDSTQDAKINQIIFYHNLPSCLRSMYERGESQSSTTKIIPSLEFASAVLFLSLNNELVNGGSNIASLINCLEELIFNPCEMSNNAINKKLFHQVFLSSTLQIQNFYKNKYNPFKEIIDQFTAFFSLVDIDPFMTLVENPDTILYKQEMKPQIIRNVLNLLVSSNSNTAIAFTNEMFYSEHDFLHRKVGFLFLFDIIKKKFENTHSDPFKAHGKLQIQRALTERLTPYLAYLLKNNDLTEAKLLFVFIVNQLTASIQKTVTKVAFRFDYLETLALLFIEMNDRNLFNGEDYILYAHKILSSIKQTDLTPLQFAILYKRNEIIFCEEKAGMLNKIRPELINFFSTLDPKITTDRVKLKNIFLTFCESIRDFCNLPNSTQNEKFEMVETLTLLLNDMLIKGSFSENPNSYVQFCTIILSIFLINEMNIPELVMRYTKIYLFLFNEKKLNQYLILDDEVKEACKFHINNLKTTLSPKMFLHFSHDQKNAFIKQIQTYCEKYVPADDPNLIGLIQHLRGPSAQVPKIDNYSQALIETFVSDVGTASLEEAVQKVLAISHMIAAESSNPIAHIIIDATASSSKTGIRRPNTKGKRKKSVR